MQCIVEKKIIKEKYKKLVSNFLSLSVLQGLNMVLPLITLPYLVRVLGVENFGLMNFSLAVIMCFNILISFGFELSATRQIAENCNDVQTVSKIFCSVMVIKLCLTLVSVIILFILALSYSAVGDSAALYFVTFGVVVGNAMFPSWFFQGMESMKYVTYVHFVFKVLLTALIFYFVTSEADILYVPALNSMASILSGLVAMGILFRMYKINLVWPSMVNLKYQFSESFHYFVSRVVNSGSRYFATMIIGVGYGNSVVGYYTMVEKLFYALVSSGGVIAQTIYPYMSRTKDMAFFKKTFSIIILVALVGTLFVMLFNEEILWLIYGVKNDGLTMMYNVVFSGAIFAIASSMLGFPLLGAFGYAKQANNSLIYASLGYIAYLAVVVLLGKGVNFLAFSIPLYMIVSFLIRVFYIMKMDFLVKAEYE